VYTFYC
jgi:hypothetical protein